MKKQFGQKPSAGPKLFATLLDARITRCSRSVGGTLHGKVPRQECSGRSSGARSRHVAPALRALGVSR